jgi:hypothetical protein
MSWEWDLLWPPRHRTVLPGDHVHASVETRIAHDPDYQRRAGIPDSVVFVDPNWRDSR